MLRIMALVALLLGIASAPIAAAHQQTAAIVAYAPIPTLFDTVSGVERGHVRSC